MISPSASAKAFLRDQIRARLKSIPKGTSTAAPEQWRDTMVTQDVWRESRRIMFFSPLAGEPDISALLDEAWRTGRILALPRFDSRTSNYVACVVDNRSRLLRGRFGVQEPDEDCPVTPLNQLDLVFVPGIAFDFNGRRLGRGKGFYDRLLAEVRGHKCGVAFEEQLVPDVPEEPHDVRVDSLLTPTRWQLCRGAV